MNELLKKLSKGAYVFFGIYDDELFVQIATHDNEIVYGAANPIAVEPEVRNIIDTLPSLFPYSFRELGIKIDQFNFYPLDGKKITKDEIQEVQPIGSIYPDPGKVIFRLLNNN